MEHISPILAPDLQQMIITGDIEALRRFITSSHPAFVAELISAISPMECWELLQNAELSLQAEIFSHMETAQQLKVVEFLRRDEVAKLLSEMSPDDRADLFKQLPEDRRENVMPALAQAEREDIRRLASYKEGTAGSVMTSDYATVLPDHTVSQAIEYLRVIAPDKETIYYAYVIDEHRRLLGFVSLKDLIVARRDAIISRIMHQEVIYAKVEDDQEEVAQKIQKYDLLALPVTDGTDALVGIITHDDAMDIITQEYTEDVEMLMAIAGSHEIPYMNTSSWDHFKNRYPWVLALAVVGLVSGFVVQSFEGLLQQFTILAAFMPMLADTGGNTGSQSATLVVRALAMKEVTHRDVFKIMGKEIQIALMLGLMLGLVAFGRVVFTGGSTTLPGAYSISLIGLAIAIALGLQVITSTLIGSVLPLLAAALKLDPAVVASPAITTVVDITGLLIYFTTVKLVLGI
jgi:magnesium transporter